MSFEKEFLKFLNEQNLVTNDNSSSYTDFDFGLYIGSNFDPIWIDVKEKKQKYNVKSWKTEIPEEEFFILDERALMKAWGLGFSCGIVIKDIPRNCYHYFSPEVLCFMPRIRGYREVTTGPMGKLLIDFRWGMKRDNLYDILTLITEFNKSGCKPKNVYSEYKNQEYRKFGQFRHRNWKKQDLVSK